MHQRKTRSFFGINPCHRTAIFSLLMTCGSMVWFGPTALLDFALPSANAFNTTDLEDLQASRNCPKCDLREVDLRGAYLEGANLRGARVNDTDLRRANLRNSDLRDADLTNVDLRGADLRGANLRGALLEGARLMHVQTDANTTLDIRWWEVIALVNDLNRQRAWSSDELIQQYADVRDQLVEVAGVNPEDEILVDPSQLEGDRRLRLERVQRALGILTTVIPAEPDESRIDRIWRLQEQLLESGNNQVDLFQYDLVNPLQSEPDNEDSDEDGRLDFRDLTGANFSHANLQGLDLTGEDLTGANFQGADLTHGQLENVEADESNWAIANLSYANLAHTRLSNAHIAMADLDGANLDHTVLYRAIARGIQINSETSLREADLRQMDWQGTNFAGVSLDNANLEGSDLRRVNLRGASLIDTKLIDVNLENADLRDVNLAQPILLDANLRGVHLNLSPSFSDQVVERSIPDNFNDLFSESLPEDWIQQPILARIPPNALEDGEGQTVDRVIENVDLRDTNLAGANFNGMTLRRVNFTGVNLEQATFIGTTLEAVNFTGVNLERATFIGATLDVVNFADANLQYANFMNATLVRSNLDNADFSNAYFGNVMLVNTSFCEAILTDPQPEC